MGDLKSRSIKALIGGRQHVRNYPGVTVERKEGFRRYGGMEMRIVDLPGTYSLTGMVGEEQKKSVEKPSRSRSKEVLCGYPPRSRSTRSVRPS